MIKKSLGNWGGLSTHTQFLEFIAFLKYVGCLNKSSSERLLCLSKSKPPVIVDVMSYPSHSHFMCHLAIFFTSMCFCCGKIVLILNLAFLLFRMFLFPILCPGTAAKLGNFIVLTVAFVLVLAFLLNLHFLLYFFNFGWSYCPNT